MEGSLLKCVWGRKHFQMFGVHGNVHTGVLSYSLHRIHKNFVFLRALPSTK